ncbi:uncharacterized protein LOC124138204 [Haliotis rufescens]|uniref:uncharacterized protein LOC124138204 n=1 Tax=Haliotis rufescens TaxID=6454 RepID=UPI00201EFEAE|nr:uncharacterized protein LOC124138204 [Haliotis rufescens]
MTSTADPAYIQAVSVGFRRSQSSLSTRSDIRIKSALSIAGYELCGDNLKKRQEVMSRVSSDDCIHSRREKAQMMEELIFLYGLHAYDNFNFPSHSSIQLRRTRSKIGNAWACENEAFRQMYNSSSRLPRRRAPLQPANFPSIQVGRHLLK